jgi:predicted house-cleaning noncanonical NTP pyrophosphatase (MazG superfamily)
MLNLLQRRYGLPVFDKDTGGGTGGFDGGNDQEPNAGEKAKNQPFITFPSEGSFMERLKREGRAQVNEFIKELGFEKIDDLKNLVKQQKETEDASKTDLEKAREQNRNLQTENQRIKNESEAVLKQAALMMQATQANIKPDRMKAFLKLIDISDITITNGIVDEVSTKTAVDNVLKEFPEFLGKAESEPTGGEDFSGGGGGKDLGNLSMADYIKARQGQK